VKPLSLHLRILLPFLAIIVSLGAIIAALDFHIVDSYVVDRTQEQVTSALRAAEAVYKDELETIRTGFLLASHSEDLSFLKSRLGLDYLFVVDTAAADSIRDPIVAQAFRGNGNGGTRIIKGDELRRMNNDLYLKARIEIKPTPHARPSSMKTLHDAMAIEYARPFFNAEGRVIRVMYGGRIINRRAELIDRIHNIVFENRIYKSKPVGTVTVFLDDIRIATNVLDNEGQPALGTRVSAEVYRNVIEKGALWLDRAFVVTDWYLTAYMPITDVHGSRIGILYVGVLEQPFTDMKRRIALMLLAIIGAGVLCAALIAVVIAGLISRPVIRLQNAAQSLAAGDLAHRIDTDIGVPELKQLATAFNEMAQKLEAREKNLREANGKLAELNKNYLDLVGMVSHELKGILSSAILNAYAVKDKFLGDLNEKQEKALASITRNLDYLTITVKRFLDLSRIEKGELVVHPSPLLLTEDVLTRAVESFSRQAQEKHIRIVCDAAGGIRLNADIDMLQVVANNLIRNAIAYGAPHGIIRISAAERGGMVEVEVYNDGTPIEAAGLQKLFRKFSRLDTSESKKVHGTGLGLFVCREIVEKHGGAIRCEPREHGNSFIFTIKKDCSA